MGFVSKWNESTDDRSYLFYFDGTNLLRFAFSTNGLSTGAEFPNVAWTPSIATWYHLAVVFTAATPSVIFYVNVVQQGATQTPVGTSISDEPSSFGIGAHNIDSTPAIFFDGLIDEVRVWNTARTSSELSANYQRELAGNESGLQGYWQLDNAYTDSTSNANNLTPSGTPVFSTDVPFTDNTTTSTSTTSTSRTTSTSTSRTTSTSTTATNTSTSTTTSTSTSRTTSTSTTSTSSSTTTTTSTTTTLTSTSTTTTTSTSTSTTTTLDYRFVVERV